MKKRVLSIILSLVLFVSAIGTSVVSVNAAGVKTKQNNLMMPSSVTVGQNEKCYIYYDVIKGSCVNLKSTSNNSNVKVIQYSTGYASSRCNYGSSLIEGKNIGTANVTVKSDNGSITGSGVTNASGSCKVTVKKAPSSVKLSITSLTLGKGEIFTISESTNSGSYANTDNLKWSSSNTKVATVLKGSDNKATIKAVGKGTAYISIKTYNGKTAKCKVTVK